MTIMPLVFRGPSIYCRHPVIRFPFGSAPAGSLGAGIDADVAGRLLSRLPGLRACSDSCGAASLLEHGIAAGNHEARCRLFEHLCIELQNQTGATLSCVRVNGSAGIAASDALVPFDDESVALAAARLALELMSGVSGRPPVPPGGNEPAADVDRQIGAFFAYAERQMLPVQDRAVVRAAAARDIPVIRVAGRLVQLGHGPFQQRLIGTQTTRTNVVGNKLAANKDYSRRVLGAVGLPVPRYERVYRARDAVAAAGRIGFPVVVKPNNSNMGRGVSIGLKTPREVRRAYRLAREFDRSVIVEEFVAGADFRMLVINGRLEAAAQRVPAHVVGDGVATIEELVNRANSDPRRGAGQRNSWTRLELDLHAERLLREQRHERTSVAREGEIVLLRRNANTSSGGTARDVTDEVHPDNREIAERAALAIGLDVAGVDLLVHDIRLSMRAQAGVICEINSKPGVRKHLWPAAGRPRDVIGPIVETLFPRGARSRIPIVAVTGSGDIAAVARLTAHLLAANGTTVGLAAGGAIFVNSRRRDGGPLDSCAATRMLLLDLGVEAAVVELAPHEVLARGLGYDWSDACAIVNGAAPGPPELADAARVVADAARDTVVLAGDEALGSELETAARIWRVNGRQPPAGVPGHHLALESVTGAPSLALWSSGTLEQRMALAPDDAYAAPEQTRSVLYAVALALSLGRRPDDIVRALAGYRVAAALDSRSRLSCAASRDS